MVIIIISIIIISIITTTTLMMNPLDKAKILATIEDYYI